MSTLFCFNRALKCTVNIKPNHGLHMKSRPKDFMKDEMKLNT